MNNEVAERIMEKIEGLKGTRGPVVAFFINVDKENDITYQGMVDDWSQELIDENRLIDFENMIDSMYGTGIWEWVTLLVVMI